MGFDSTVSQSIDLRVRYDAGWGNRLSLRGSGGNLSWQQGLDGQCLASHEWHFQLRVKPGEKVTCKPLLNDVTWAVGGDFELEAGMQRAVYPFFNQVHGHFQRIRTSAIPLDIYLPPSYRENLFKHYPVLYVQDGQNLFDPKDSFKGESWEIHNAVNRLVSMGEMTETIIVGVHHRGGRRLYDFTPTRDSSFGARGAGGGAGEFGDLLLGEIKPFIDRTYRTKTDAANTGVMGASLGGLVALYLGLTHPNVVGKVACLSSSFWWDNHNILKHVKKKQEAAKIKIYLDSGMFETGLKDSRAMYRALLTKGFRLGENLLFYVAPFHRHSERYWAERVHIPLRFLFPHLDEKVELKGSPT